MIDPGKLPQPSAPGDVAAAALGYAVGFGVDVLLFPLGIPPGVTAGVWATGAVGLKKSIDAILHRRPKPTKALLPQKPQTDTESDLTRRVHALRETVEELSGSAKGLRADLLTAGHENDITGALSKLTQDLEEMHSSTCTLLTLLERKILEDHELTGEFRELVTDYRNRREDFLRLRARSARFNMH